jgi:nucleoside-diphosphate-sugar epimerase
VCKVHEKFSTVDQSGIWNVGTEHPCSFLEIAEAVAEKENAQVIEIDMPADLKQQYQEYTCADLTNLEKIVKIDWIDVIDWIKR